MEFRHAKFKKRDFGQFNRYQRIRFIEFDNSYLLSREIEIDRENRANFGLYWEEKNSGIEKLKYNDFETSYIDDGLDLSQELRISAQMYRGDFKKVKRVET